MKIQNEALAKMTLQEVYDTYIAEKEPLALDILNEFFARPLADGGVTDITITGLKSDTALNPRLTLRVSCNQGFSEELYTMLQKWEWDPQITTQMVDVYPSWVYIRVPTTRAAWDCVKAGVERHKPLGITNNISDSKESAMGEMIDQPLRFIHGREILTGDLYVTRYVAEAQPGANGKFIPDLIRDLYNQLIENSSCKTADDKHPLLADVQLWQVVARLDDGQSVPLPHELGEELGIKTLIAQLPAVVSNGEKKGMVTYFTSPEKGVKGQPAYAKPGRYLRRLLKEAGDEDIKHMAAQVASTVNFEFKEYRKASNFRWAYLNGPQSCMSYGESKFSRTYVDGEWVHPVEAYAYDDNDISLIALVAERNGSCRVAARALVNRGTMEYPRIYAADWFHNANALLTNYLESQGFAQHDNALDGQKLARIDLDNGAILCPYIDDGNIPVDIYDDHLYITRDGENEAEHETGTLGEGDTQPCNDCGERVHEDDITCIIWNDHHVCPSCLEENYTYAATSSTNAEHIHDEDVFELPITVSPRWSNSTDYAVCDIDTGELEALGVVRCQEDDEWIDRDEATPLENGDGFVSNEYVLDEVVHPEKLKSCHRYIAIDGEAVPLDECFFHQNEERWEVRCDYDFDELEQVEHYTYREREAA